MTAPAKYQVFISSTYEDLKEERDQVIRAVLEMGHIPVGMEMFSAADEEQWRIIARHIEESDYYAVVSAHRLGSLTADGISYTRKEYEYARDLGVPILGFVIDDRASWPPQHVETNTRNQKALQAFKELIQEKPVSFWSSAEDLYGKFSVSLMKAITASPREGWIRASTSTAGPEVTAEVVRLSSENAKLRKRLADVENAAQKEHKEELRRTVDTLFATEKSLSYRYFNESNWELAKSVSLFDIFDDLGTEMMVEASVEHLAGVLAMAVREDKDRSWDIVALNQVRSAVADLMTLDLVQPSTRKHPVSDKAEYWSLSTTGIEVLKTIRKVSLSHTPADEPLPEESSVHPASETAHDIAD